MKLLFTTIVFMALFLGVNARAEQPDLIESGVLREDGKRFVEYHREAQLSPQTIASFRHLFLNYTNERLKKGEVKDDILCSLKGEWQYSGEMLSRPKNLATAGGKVIGLIYKAGGVTVLVYNDVVMAQWLAEDAVQTTRRKWILVAGWNGEDVKQIVIEE